MIVSELIAELQKMPQDAQVKTVKYGDGVCAIDSVISVEDKTFSRLVPNSVCLFSDVVTQAVQVP